MKKKFKGFTLIECLIALAILGIASLTMAQIYASVSKRNRNNHLINSSLANQMAYVEKYTDTEAHAIYFNSDASGVSKPDPEAADTSTTKKPPHKQTTTKPYVKIVSSYKPTGATTGAEYSYSADVYILQSRDTDDVAVSESDEKEYALRYKYLTGHVNE